MKQLSLRKAWICFLFALFPLSGLAQSGIIATHAGTGGRVNGALATTLALGSPQAVASDGRGGLYIASSAGVVFRLSATGFISTVAGNGITGFSGDGSLATEAQLSLPAGLAVDGAGNLFIADMQNYRIRKVTAAGVITTVAGNGTRGFSGDGGPATAAQLDFPMGVAADPAGNLYIADYYNSRIRKVSAAGVISTVVGTGTPGFSGDGGQATTAQLNHPNSVAIDSAFNLYISDRHNYRIRKVATAGVISTVAGTGTSGFSGDGGPATAAQLYSPIDVTVDTEGQLYIAELDNHRIRKVTAVGIISTVAGNGASGFSGDGGQATASRLNCPNGVVIDSVGNIYISDSYNYRIRKVTAAGVISTVAGNGMDRFSGDGGPATAAQLHFPRGIAADSAGNLFIAEVSNARIRKVTSWGAINTVAGNGIQGFSGDGGSATEAKLSVPVGIAADSGGNVYFTDPGAVRIRKITATGVISTVAGNGNQGFSGDGGPATEARLNFPTGLAVDSAGNLFFIDSDNHRIRKVTASGVIRTVAGSGTPGFSGDGGPATEAQLNFPLNVAVDSTGNLFIADSNSARIRKVTAAGVISTVAGNGISGFSGDGGPATAARLNRPVGVAVDSAGNLYISDIGAYRIRRVTPGGVISTVAGTGIQGSSGDGGPATEAQLYSPADLAVDPAGNLYFTDALLNRIRKISSRDICSSLTLNSGGAAACRTTGSSQSTRAGYATLVMSSGATPYATAVLTLSQNGTTVSEAGVPASPPTKSARLFIDYRKGVNAVPARSDAGIVDTNTGIAVMNYGSYSANVTYTLRDASGETTAVGSGRVKAGHHFACFIDQLKNNGVPDFNLPADFQSRIQFGTLDISADQPLSVLALRGTINQRSEFLMTTTPVADLTQMPGDGPTYFPQFADGGGYTTSLILLNTSNLRETGRLEIMDKDGNPLSVNRVGGTRDYSFNYLIEPNGLYRFQADGFPAGTNAGWVQLIPDAGTSTPVGSGIFGYNPADVLVSESGIPATVATTHARVYVDLSENHNTGLAMANISGTGSNIAIMAYQNDGVSAAGNVKPPIHLVSNGYMAAFADQFVTGLPAEFTGVLDISSSEPFAALTLRSLINERNEFLMTTFPVADANRPASSPVVFPQIVDGGGYVTEIILISDGQAASTQISFFDETGASTSSSVVDQSNLERPGSMPGWLAMSWTISQTFKPSMPVLTGVDIDILTANAFLGSGDITVQIRDNNTNHILATASRTVQPGFAGLLHFDFAQDVPLSVGDTYVLYVPGSKDTFGWKYSGDTYPNGFRTITNWQGPRPYPNQDCLFQTYGRPAS